MDDSESIESFLNHLTVERGLSKNTVAAYRGDLSKLSEYLAAAGENLLQADSKAVALFVASLRAGRLSEPSIARTTVAIRSFYRFVAKEDGLESAHQIVEEVSPPAIPRRLPKALTVKEVSDLIESCPGEGIGLRDRALIELLYATGARVSELVGLDTSDLRQSKSATFTIRVKGKGGKERLVPIGSYARNALDQYLTRMRPILAAKHADAALFLNQRGTRLTRQSAWNVVLIAARRAGLERKVSPHALRHSFATHLIDGGADIRVVQELLGHAAVTTTQIYTLVTIDKIRESYATAHPRAR